MAHIDLSQLSKTYDGEHFAVDHLDLHIADGEFLVLVGPSGCGKSTALRMIAGLEEISSGELRIGDVRVNDLSPRQRNIAMVFQSYALYPSKTVYDNIAFPLRMQGGLRASAIKEQVLAVADTLDLRSYLDRLPKALSGGQRQRVAMARALVRSPVAFLMDEPLSNLDAKLRVHMRGEILALQRKTRTTTVYVTHDQVEAMTMGDRVAVLNQGRLQQVDKPQNLYRYPGNSFVATFIGSPAMTLFPPQWEEREGQLGILLCDCWLPIPEASLKRWGGADAMQQAQSLGLRPEHWRRSSVEEGGAVVSLESVEQLGHEQLVFFSLPGMAGTEAVRCQARIDSSQLHAAGEQLCLSPDLSQLHLFNAQGQRCPDAEVSAG